MFQFDLLGRADSEIGSLYDVTPFKVFLTDGAFSPKHSNIAPSNART
jgi:hypothetical protein